jgi:hypothetical protein
MKCRFSILGVAILVSMAGPAGPITAQEAPRTAVVTHGFQLFGSLPEWPLEMANGIAHRAADLGGEEGSVWIYDASTGDLFPCQDVLCSANGSAMTAIVFDWAADSNESGAGFSEAAAETLFAGLIAWSRGPNPRVDLTRLHLIGHSRGAVVNSEVAERLIAAGFPAPEQVTTLDPHDAGSAFQQHGQAPAGGLDDYDVNREHPEYDCHIESSTPGVCAWVGTGYHDNYWQNSSSCTFSPDGRELFGASNFHQNGLDTPFCHSDTHLWYRLTVDITTGEPPNSDWFGTGSVCTSSPRTEPLTRTADGYNLSVIGGGVANRCPTGPNERQEVLFDFGLAEGLVNGDFERIRMGATESGWSFHGGDLQGTFETDGDTHLVLSAGGFARHNRFHLPDDTFAIQLCRRVTAASADASLSLLLTSEEFTDRELLAVDQQSVAVAGDWECLRAPVLANETGNRVQIEVSVTDLGAPIVLVDDLRLVPASIFADGFESGDTTAWTTSVP